MGWISDIVGEVIKAAAKFSRKRPPEGREPFGRNHFPDIYGRCVYCEQRPADASKPCPEPK